jgi:hypothetical protein
MLWVSNGVWLLPIRRTGHYSGSVGSFPPSSSTVVQIEQDTVSLRLKRMPRLFTYTIPIDDGAAPNPFRGMCSLAICKPCIRRVAEEHDWVAGLDSKNAPAATFANIWFMR